MRTRRKILPLFASAAERKVRVDLLWGLNHDPEDEQGRTVVANVRSVLEKMTADVKRLVQLSPLSSGSHAKFILYDGEHNEWTTVLGSCNFLQSAFVSLDVSVRSRSRRFARQLLSRTISTQIPASGGWSSVARRLNADWDRLHQGLREDEQGTHRLMLLVDQDHYACVRRARDRSQRSIIIGCDLFGLAAETSVVVPMERAAELGRSVRLLYQRPTKLLRDTGRPPDADALRKRGISLEKCPGLHGKFLLWDEEHLAITSFNWLSTVADGTRVRGAEIGVLIEGPSLAQDLTRQMKLASKGKVDLSEGSAIQEKLNL
jgi:phosphatidylserine/phosphatidylglycerophosphate/cardiolipin synthase-like enzyme